MAEIAKFCVAGVKRIYGDWTTNQSARWKAKLLEHSLAPMQQIAYTTGKNATDSAPIIDATGLLYTGRFDGFCRVSSDSDFTRLSQRLREGGVAVFGFGERKTPKPFVVRAGRNPAESRAESWCRAPRCACRLERIALAGPSALRVCKSRIVA